MFMIFQRNLFSTLVGHIESPEIIVLTGMRQVGKTTLYQSLFAKIPSANKLFLDIENPLSQKIFEETDYNNIWKNLAEMNINPKQKAYVFLDEIQAMPSIVKPIKYLYDHYKIKFFLTGSSSFYLKNLFPESLAGRKFIFELYPLDFSEFLVFNNVSKQHNNSFDSKNAHKNLVSYEKTIKLYEQYLKYGGFPRVVVEKDTALKRLILSDIFKSYYEKDIKGLSNFRDLNSIRDLILLLTQRVGSKLDISKLSSELGISRETVYSYLNFLKATYFISTVSPFSKNRDREISGGNKIYLCDTGILNNISKVSSGTIFENAVFNNLKKYGKLNYYQKRKSNQEIDFILNEKVAIEVKTKATKKYQQNLAKLSKGLGIKSHYIVSKEFVDFNGVVPATEI
jgi:uncharacterized protein